MLLCTELPFKTKRRRFFGLERFPSTFFPHCRNERQRAPATQPGKRIRLPFQQGCVLKASTTAGKRLCEIFHELGILNIGH
jgi:hypothetical protein